MVCSLTRSAAREAAGREIPIDPNLIGTLHSHAFRSLGSPTMVDEKNISNWNEENPLYELSEKSFSNDIPSESRGGPSTYGDDCYSELNLLRATCVPSDQWPQHVVKFANRWKGWKDDGGLMDFADMIETTTLHCPVAPGSPTHLIVDECQDMSKAELNLLRKWATKTQALIIVGDPYQALYVWRGAYPSMFWNVGEESREVLSQSYRVPRAVHAASMRWVRQLSDFHPIEYHPTDEEGLVSGHSASWDNPWPLVELIEADLEEGRDIMIQAPCDYMVAPTVKMLRDAGIPFGNPWRTRRGDWNPLAHRKGNSTRDRLEALVRPLMEHRAWKMIELKAWTEVTRSRGILGRGAKSRIEAAAKDNPYRPVTLEEIKEWIEPEIVGQIMTLSEPEDIARWWVEKAKPEKQRAIGYLGNIIQREGIDGIDRPPRVYVGTIHSFKGAEAHTTITFPDLSRAGWDEWESNPDSIIRLGYVALTRARERAFVCTPAGNNYMPIMEVVN